MPLSKLMTDTVSLLKGNGEATQNIKASVQKDKIFVQRSDLLIETGDLIRRTMSNGGEETYEVIDPGFHERFRGIPAGYQMDVRKLGLPEAKSAVQNITYNISGTNNRVNQNTTDNSVNVVNMSPELREHIDKLRREIKDMGLPKEEEIASYELIDTIETQLENEKPSKTVIKTLISSLPKVASIASIGSFIISCL